MRSSVEELSIHEDGPESDPEPAWNPKSYFRANLIGALATLGFGVTIILAANNYALIVNSLPGPGLYPLIIGTGMTILAILWAIGTLLGRHAPGEETGSPSDGAAVVRAALALLAVTAFVFALNPIGYPISASVLVMILVLLARGSARKAIVGGPIFGIVSYLVITYTLGVPLSIGVLDAFF